MKLKRKAKASGAGPEAWCKRGLVQRAWYEKRSALRLLGLLFLLGGLLDGLLRRLLRRRFLGGLLGLLGFLRSQRFRGLLGGFLDLLDRRLGGFLRCLDSAAHRVSHVLQNGFFVVHMVPQGLNEAITIAGFDHVLKGGGGLRRAELRIGLERAPSSLPVIGDRCRISLAELHAHASPVWPRCRRLVRSTSRNDEGWGGAVLRLLHDPGIGLWRFPALWINLLVLV